MKNYVHPFRNQFVIRSANSNSLQQIIGLSFHSKGLSTVVSFTTFQVGKQILIRLIFLPLMSIVGKLLLDHDKHQNDGHGASFTKGQLC